MNNTKIEQAQRAYPQGVPGWYAVNQRTNLAVSGPHPRRDAAERYIAEMDREYPFDAGQGLVAVEVAGE